MTDSEPNLTLKQKLIEEKSSTATASAPGTKSRKRNHRTLSDDEREERANDPQELNPETMQQIEPLHSSPTQYWAHHATYAQVRPEAKQD